METTSESINSVPIEGTEMFTFKPSDPQPYYTIGEIADKVAKLALKKLIKHIRESVLIGVITAVIVAVLLILIF